MKVRMPKKGFIEGEGGGLSQKFGGLLNWQIFSNWGVAQKLWTIAAALSVPVVILLYLLIAEQNIRIDFANQEQMGLEYLSPATEVLKYAQQARGMTIGVLESPEGSGQQEAQSQELARIQKNLQGAMVTLKEKDNQFGQALQSTAAFDSLSQKLQETIGQGLAVSSSESQALYTRFINEQVIGIIQKVANTSNLNFDPDTDSYYMMNSIVRDIPALTEALGKLRALSIGIITRGDVTEQEKAQIAGLINLAQSAEGNLKTGFKLVLEVNPSLEAQLGPLYSDLSNKMNQFFTALDLEIINADFMTASQETMSEIATAPIESAFALSGQNALVMKNLLNDRIDGFENNRLISLLTVAIALLIAFAGLVLVIRGITASLGQVGQAAEQISTGDLTTEVPVTSRDEFGQLGQTFNRTIDQIGSLLKEARDVAEQVSLNSNEMMFSSDRMVTGVQEQNTEAAKVAQAIQGVVDSIHQVSETAAGAALAAERAMETSLKGDEAVRESLEGMNRIRNDVQALSKKIKGLGDRSLEIYEIVNTIQEIASQTNLLALNAAIEAAGAGEAGLRFGVVADDVRKLAERSSQATKDIAGLIKNVQTEIQDAVVAMEEGTAEVERDYQITVQAGENLKAIAEVSRESAALSQDISRATNSQVEGAQNVAVAVQAIAKVAGQTEEGVQMTRQTMAELSRLAVQLAESLGRFKLAT